MDSQAAEPPRKKKKLKNDTSVSAPTLSAEERLAAFGDAFLESIEGPPPSVQKQRRTKEATSGDEEAQDDEGQDKLAVGTGPGKRKKKKKGRQPNASVASVVPKAPGARTEQLSKTGSLASPLAKPSSDKQAPRAPPRMSAAEKRRFMSGKVSDIRSKGGPQNASRRGDPEEDAEFKKTLREVLDYVTPQLGKQERRQYEQAKIRALGGQIDERPKRPINLLKKDAEIFERKRKAKLEEEKHLGVSLSASKHRGRYEVDKLLKEKKEMLKDKKRRREDGFLRLGLGAKENRGMAVISKGAIRKYGGRG